MSRTLLLGTLALLLAAPPSLHAQSSTDEPAAGAAGEPSVEPVPVEAAESIEDSPTGVESISIVGEMIDSADVQDEAQAVSAFTFEQLDRANITNVDGLAFNVPSLHIGQQGNQAIITLRGIGTQNASITGEPGVQFHVDGINFARPSAARVAFFDLEAVKVHRGPYGTRGGKNATGGAIEVVTRKPSSEYEVDLDFEWGSHDRRRWRGAVNIPLVDEVLAARFAFIQDKRNGYQINLTDPSKSKRADDSDSLGMRAHLRYTPTDTLDMLFSYNYYKAEGVGPASKQIQEAGLRSCPEPLPENDPSFLFSRQLGGETFFFFRNLRGQTVSRPRGVIESAFTRHTRTTYCARFANPNIDRAPTEDPRDPRKVYLDRVQSQDNVFWGWSSSIDWDVPELPFFGETHIKALGGFQSTSLSDPRDFDATDIPFFVLEPVDTSSGQYSAELRWGSVLNETFEWLTGVYYQRETSEAFVLGDIGVGAATLTIDQATLVKTYGVFGETKLHLTDSVTATLGARFNRDFKESFLSRGSTGDRQDPSGGATGLAVCLSPEEARILGAQLSGRGGLSGNVPTCSENWRRWSGGVGLEWRPTDDQLLYARFDKGYKAGGFVVLDSGSYKPETVKSTTIGSKSVLFDGRLTLNLEAYNYSYSDYQVVEIDGLSIRTESAPEVRVRGVDLEFDAEPLPGLRLNGQVGYLDAEFRSYKTIDPLQIERAALFRDGSLLPEALDDLSGNPMPRSPLWSYTAGIEYEIPIGQWGSLTPRLQYYWQDETFYRAYSSPLDLQEKYHKTDVKLLWRGQEGRWGLEAYVENLEDDDVFQNLLAGSALVGTPLLAQFSAPRTYGFRVSFSY